MGPTEWRGRREGKVQQKTNAGSRGQEASVEKKDGTYDRSSGVEGCDPLKLCAKLTFPPSCRDAGFCRLAPPIGMLPLPNAQPEPLLATHANAPR